MRKEPLAIILTSDLAAKARGRSAPQSEFERYLERGCGWVPANLAIDPFGGIVTPNPFGSVGDLRMMPDPATTSQVVARPGETPTLMVLADLYTPDGKPWANDPRGFLRRAIADLDEETGLRAISSFEHEFMLLDDNPSPVNTPFSLEAFLAEEDLGGRVMGALTDAGLEPEMWLPEFGRDQFEVTLAPAAALVAADRAIYLREIVKHVARGLGKRATFSPITETDGGGNGVHVHVSLQDAEGNPVMYDPARPGKLSEIGGAFAAGILEYAEAIQVLTASSTISYERLAPHRWSVGGIFLGENNREALLRICPLFDLPGADHSRQYNLEYRAADATSNPWIVLGVLIRAGLEGIRRGLPSPEVISGNLEDADPEQLARANVRPTPADLGSALDLFLDATVVRDWFAPEFVETLAAVKRSEIARTRSLGATATYDAYSTTY